MKAVILAAGKGSICTHLRVSAVFLSGLLAPSISFFGEAITKGDGFELHAHSVGDGNHRARLENKRREHRAELVDQGGIVAIQHHIAAPVTHPDDEQFDLEIGGSLPLSEDLQNALLGILVFNR